MRKPLLFTVLRWLAVGLILRVLLTILSNYPDYFPPNFDSLFLEGREATFTGIYVPAFYVHLFTAPVVLLNGLFLMSDSFRLHSHRVHRWLGRVQVMLILFFVVPSSLVMARHAFAGWAAGLSFLLLSLATGLCAVMGTYHALSRRFQLHRRWMSRCFILLCSAVVLRLVSGAATLLQVSNEEGAYILAAWGSWLVPLLIFELKNGSLPKRRVGSR